MLTGISTQFSNLPLKPAKVPQAGLLNDKIYNIREADVLVVLAHPDDEFFFSGTIARLIQSGYTIQFVYLTSGGNANDDSGRSLKGQALAKEREYELRAALKNLGVDRLPILLRYENGKITEATHGEAIKSDLRQLLLKVKPKLVITFGSDGVYGHLEHILAGKFTDEVCRDLKVDNLYHIAFSTLGKPPMIEAFQKGAEKYKGNIDTYFLDNWRWVDPKCISTRINVEPFIPLKVQTLKSHQTQFFPYRVDIFKQFYTKYPQEEFIKVQ